MTSHNIDWLIDYFVMPFFRSLLSSVVLLMVMYYFACWLHWLFDCLGISLWKWVAVPCRCFWRNRWLDFAWLWSIRAAKPGVAQSYWRSIPTWDPHWIDGRDHGALRFPRRLLTKPFENRHTASRSPAAPTTIYSAHPIVFSVVLIFRWFPWFPTGPVRRDSSKCSSPEWQTRSFPSLCFSFRRTTAHEDRRNHASRSG